MKDKIIFSMGIIISLVIIGCSAWLYYQNTKLIVKTTNPVPTIKPQTISYDEKSNYKNTEIQVLNGTEIAGKAKKFANTLSNLGYIKITTGNYNTTVTGNLLLAPTDFGSDIKLENYKYQKSDQIKIIIGK